jgi:glutamyl-Q tRNA(Asp) synthetase
MIVTRFAPSPTGFLHLGHAFAALTAARAGERFVLRIEDIDMGRCREEFVAAIFEDLHWLGLAWEEPVLRQSGRSNAYRMALDTLEAQGLLYPCFCTRKEIADEIARAAEAPHVFDGTASLPGLDGPLYPGTCRHLSEGERKTRIATGAAYALRLDVMKAAALTGPLTFQELGAGPNGEHGMVAVRPGLFGDIVLARKEMPAAYHLAVVVDDAHQGITRVTRGNDLFAATHVQRLLQALLDLPVPDYAHHRLILDDAGRKFSKRDHAVTLRSLRANGTSADAIRTQVGL